VIIPADIADRLRTARGFVFDLDGTLVLGDKKHGGMRALPGALELTRLLRDRGIPFVVLTSGSAKTPGEYAQTLKGVGFPSDHTTVQTPASVAAEYFVRRKLGRVMVLGSAGAWLPLEEAGIEVIRPGVRAAADAVFIGFYRDFTIDHLEAACQAIWQGAKLFTSAYVPVFATAQGKAIGIPLALCSAIQAVTGCRAKILGKPSIEALRTAGRFLGAGLTDLVVVGDDPLLEVAMAHRGGALAIGVTTGLAKSADFAALPPPRRPHLVLDDVGGLLAMMR